MVKTFKAKLDNLREMLGFIKREATLNGFDDKSLNRIELASEEVLINIIQYGYSKQDGIIEIDCQTSGKSGIKIVIKDQGVPFNPLENKSDYNVEADVDDRPIGGCGIFFITNLMDEVKYDRIAESNVLTLVKYR